MKSMIFFRFCFFILFIICKVRADAQSLSSRQVKSLTSLGKFWGFLKYHHPRVAMGEWDWDSVLFAKIPEYLRAKNDKEVDVISNAWLDELGDPPGALNTRLRFINEHSHKGNGYYAAYDQGNRMLVNFIHEKPYDVKEWLYPTPQKRLLLLYRYWNIVKYFSPYKKLADENWEKLLSKRVSAFYNAADSLDYYLQYIKLINVLGDGHSMFHSGQLDHYFGKSWKVPFLCIRLKRKFVVYSILNDSMASSMNIKKGDVLLKINGENVRHRYREFAPYTMASNSPNRAINFSAASLFRAHDSVFQVTLKRKGEIHVNTIVLSHQEIPIQPTPPWTRIEDSIGYVNMELLQKVDVDKMMTEFKNTRGIIFDIRNYPKGTWQQIASKLCTRLFVMSSVYFPDLDNIGSFKIEPPIYYGTNNKNPYRGKIVLLVNESTVSHAEFSAMGLQSATNAITIGSTTAGKDGNVTNFIILPGGWLTRFSGIGITYPDETQTQRTGVKIDIWMRPSIKGLQDYKDELLEKGIQVIKKVE